MSACTMLQPHHRLISSPVMTITARPADFFSGSLSIDLYYGLAFEL